VRAYLEELPSLLDRVDGTSAEKITGDDKPNAADFQIATSVRAHMTFAELARSRPGGPPARSPCVSWSACPSRSPRGFREWVSAARPGRSIGVR
jgi:hypothetical protein